MYLRKLVKICMYSTFTDGLTERFGDVTFFKRSAKYFLQYIFTLDEKHFHKCLKIIYTKNEKFLQHYNAAIPFPIAISGPVSNVNPIWSVPNAFCSTRCDRAMLMASKCRQNSRPAAKTCSSFERSEIWSSSSLSSSWLCGSRSCRFGSVSLATRYRVAAAVAVAVGPQNFELPRRRLRTCAGFQLGLAIKGRTGTAGLHTYGILYRHSCFRPRSTFTSPKWMATLFLALWPLYRSLWGPDLRTDTRKMSAPNRGGIMWKQQQPPAMSQPSQRSLVLY